MVESPRLDDEEDDPFAPRDEADRLAASISVGGSQINLAEIAADQDDDDRDVVRLADPNPLRYMQGELHELWKEALTALRQAQARPGAKPPTHRHVPVGPYRLTVIPSIRGRAAGQIAIQGMVQKQIELTTPTVRTKGSAGKPLVAIWVYRDNSLVIAHLDFMGSERFVLWHAPKEPPSQLRRPRRAQPRAVLARHGDPRPARQGPDPIVPAQEDRLRRRRPRPARRDREREPEGRGSARAMTILALRRRTGASSRCNPADFSPCRRYRFALWRRWAGGRKSCS